jgi:excinuclease UvrABC ATPase subunit
MIKSITGISGSGKSYYAVYTIYKDFILPYTIELKEHSKKQK